MVLEQKQFEMIKHSEINEMAFELAEFHHKMTHYHKEIEVSLILEGELRVRTTNEMFLVHAGDTVLFNSYQPHELLSTEGECKLLSVYIQKNFCERYFPALLQLRFLTSNVSEGLAHSLLNEKEKEYYGEGITTLLFNLGYNYYLEEFGFELRCYSDLNSLVYALLKVVPFEVYRDSVTEGAADHEGRMERIINYVSEEYMNLLTLNDIAKREHLTPSYLSHYVKNHLGISFQDYLSSVRFEHAVQLLIQTDKTLTEISNLSGFSDGKYLNRMFLKNYGIRPKEFRELAKSNWDSVAPQRMRGGRTMHKKEECLKVLRSFYHFTCDDRK